MFRKTRTKHNNFFDSLEEDIKMRGKLESSTLKKATKVLMLLGTTVALFANASSHREAPQISAMPRVDGTDLYMFRSYEPGREGFVTLLANYLPLQDAYGGPNYFDLEKKARYEIHIDNDGDAREDITFRFRISDIINDSLKVNAGGELVSVPLKNIGPIGPTKNDVGNVVSRQTYRLDMIRGDRRFGRRDRVRGVDGTRRFLKPADYIGTKSIANYETYAKDHIYDVNIPGCGQGRVFVGQRKEGFVVNLGEIFDLINLNPLGPVDARPNTIAGKNITTLALEIPVDCLTAGDEDVIGAWTTASIPQARIINPRPNFDRGFDATIEGGPFVQVSRLGMPLVNEVIIGLKDKDRFNASHPRRDSQFATYVTNPALPELINLLFGKIVAPTLDTIAPTNFPRQDLVATFLTGFSILNQPKNVVPSEMLRLNTAVPELPTRADLQSPFGVAGDDLAGFPNGRRPGDDVVDVSLRVAMGALCFPIPVGGQATDLGLCNPSDAAVGNAPLTDGAAISAADFDIAFPYLLSPIPGAFSQVNN